MGQEWLVAGAVVGALIYLAARSRIAQRRAREQSQACSRCRIGRPDRLSGASEIRDTRKVSRPIASR